MEDSASYNFPLQNWAFAKDIYQHGAVPLPRPGESRDIVLAGVTRDVAAGAYVSVPSENLAFVFGGSRVSHRGDSLLVGFDANGTSSAE